MTRRKRTRPWDRLLWGVEFTNDHTLTAPILIGTAWLDPPLRPDDYPSESTRALLFRTREPARAVSVASAAITLHPDGRAYFDSGAATKHFRGALAALLEVLDEVLRHG